MSEEFEFTVRDIKGLGEDVDVIDASELDDPEANNTGSYSLDFDLVRPFPGGRFTEVFGDEGCGKCVSRTSLITTSDGIFRIEDLCKAQNESSVLNRYGVFNPIEYYYDNGVADTIRLRTSLGNLIEATSNHRIIVFDGSDFVWRRMDEITINDVIPHSLEGVYDNKKALLSCDDEAYIYGLLIGDGGLTQKSQFTFTNTTLELINVFRNYFQSFGYHVHCYGGIDYRIHDTKLRSSIQIPLWNSHQKRVPDVILQGSSDHMDQFIAGYWDADGEVDDRHVCITSVSRELMEDLQTCLFARGIASTIKQKNGTYQGKPHTSWRLSVHASCFQRFAEIIHLRHPAKRNRLETLTAKSDRFRSETVPGIETLVLDLIQVASEQGLNLYSRERPEIRNFVDDTFAQAKAGKCMTRRRIFKLLSLTSDIASHRSHILLTNIGQRNFVFAHATSIERGQEHTYDVHVPDGHEFLITGVINHNTTLTLEAAGQALQAGKRVLYINMEKNLNRSLMMSIRTLKSFLEGDGDAKSFQIAGASCGEDAFNLARRWAETCPNSLIILDSVDACVPRDMISGNIGDKHMGGMGKLMSEACRALVHAVEQNNVSFIFINQFREKVGISFGDPRVTPGGRALRYYSSQRILLMSPDTKSKIKGEEGEPAIGHWVRYQVIKNKCAPHGRTGQFPLIYGRGIDRETELVDMCLKFGLLSLGGKGGKQVLLPVLKDGKPDEDEKPLVFKRSDAAARLREIDTELAGYLDAQLQRVISPDEAKET